MAHIVYRVGGKGPNGKSARVEEFRDDAEGRTRAKAHAATLREPWTSYEVRWRVDSRERCQTFARRKDADAHLHNVESQKLRGVMIDPRRSRTTVEDYGRDWLLKRHDLAEKTAELYDGLLENHIVPTFGPVSLGAVQPSAVRTWHATLAKKHPPTAAKAYRLLRQVMGTAVADEIVTRNPCQVKGAGQETAPERPIASIAEVDALAAAMPEHLRIAVLLAFWCQLRRGELLGLHRRDIDPLNGKLTIRTTRVTTKGSGTVEKVPKTEAGRRTVTVPTNILPALRGHLKEHVEPEANAPVLVGVFGGPVLPGVLQDAWNRARVKIGRPELRLHDLRHSGLTLAAMQGATTRQLMLRAGHASPAAALRYQHATEEHDRELAELLAASAATGKVVRIAPRGRRGDKSKSARSQQPK